VEHAAVTTPVPIRDAVIPKWVKEEFANGQIPESRMHRVAPIGEGFLVPEAAGAWVELQTAFKTATGRALTMTGAYRTLKRQKELKQENPEFAGTPGKSNHGWGCAVDMALDGFGNNANPIGENAKAMEWLATHETLFGWSHEHSPKPGKPHGKEPWHIRLVADRPGRGAADGPPIAPSHVLQPGSKGGNVKLLQDILAFWKFDPGSERNGVFGPQTEAAVKRLQQKVVPAGVQRDQPGVYGAPTHFFLQLFLTGVFKIAHPGG
jgi:hypothetical protein